MKLAVPSRRPLESDRARAYAGVVGLGIRLARP